jgi:hypothetical protein
MIMPMIYTKELIAKGSVRARGVKDMPEVEDADGWVEYMAKKHKTALRLCWFLAFLGIVLVIVLNVCFAALECANQKTPDEIATCEYVRDRATIGKNSEKLKLAMSNVAGNTAGAFFLGYFQGYLTFFMAFPGWFKTWQGQRKAHFENKEDQVCVHPNSPDRPTHTCNNHHSPGFALCSSGVHSTTFGFTRGAAWGDLCCHQSQRHI